MDKLPQISQAEYDIMKILWSEYPLSTNEVCQRAQQTHKWNQKTIHTLLSRLTSKNVLSYEKRGRMYYYFPAISQAKYLEQEHSLFLDRFYEGEVGSMLSSLLTNSKLSDSDLENLYTIIDSRMKNGGK